MESVRTYVQSLKAPLESIFKPVKPAEYTFSTALKALDHQRIARITKTALFIFASISTATTFVLSEASLVSWPILLPMLLATLTASGIYYYLNKIDHKYTEGLDASKRAELAKKELKNLFHEAPRTDGADVKRRLCGVNQLLGYTLFSKEYLIKILEANEKGDKALSLADVASAFNAAPSISCQEQWRERGFFGLPSYTHSLEIQWSGKNDDPFILTLESTVLKPEDD